MTEEGGRANEEKDGEEGEREREREVVRRMDRKEGEG